MQNRSRKHHASLHSQIFHLSRINILGLFILLLLDIVNASANADKCDNEKFQCRSDSLTPLDIEKCYPIGTNLNLFFSISGTDSAFLKLYHLDSAKSKTSAKDETHAATVLLGRDTLTFFSHFCNSNRLVSWLTSIDVSELADRVMRPDEIFLEEITIRFRRTLRKGDLSKINDMLQTYPRYKKELISSVTLNDLSILKKGDKSPDWERDGVGDCREDNKNQVYAYIDKGLCARWSRVPLKGSYEEITDFLYAYVTEQADSDNSKKLCM